jgi:hypothetical protein
LSAIGYVRIEGPNDLGGHRTQRSDAQLELCIAGQTQEVLSIVENHGRRSPRAVPLGTVTGVGVPPFALIS